MMDQERTGILLAKYVAGELSPEEKEELEWVFIANPGLRETARVLQSLRETPPPGHRAGEEEEMLERGLRRFQSSSDQGYAAGGMRSVRKVEEVAKPEGMGVEGEKMEEAGKGRVRRIKKYRWMVAASLLILVATGAALYLRPLRPAGKPVLAGPVLPASSKEISTKYGTRSFLELPDGSKLWLNAGTSVKYADGFAGGKRELTLSGEAFFDVRHDPAHPFIVHIGRLDVKVLGTSFNVKAYPGDRVMETTLINGKVEIGVAGQKTAGIILQPNDKVIIPFGDAAAESLNPKQDPRAVSDVSFSRHSVAPDSVYRTIIETSWVDDKLVFRSERFSEVAAKLERWYNIRFRFENDKYLSMGLTGYFKGQPVENVLDALSLSLGFHYKIEGGVVRIW